MEKLIPNRPIRGTVRATESKSYVHRYLITSFLSGDDSKVLFYNLSDDVMATKHGIRKLLAADADTPVTIECGNSGTTFRFLLPLAAALGKDVKFMISPSLARRPTAPLYDALSAHGASIKELEYEEENCVRVRDKLFPGEFEIPGYISSQFISGLMFALPLLSGQSTIIVQGSFHSKSYVDMTISVLKQAGIEVIEEEPADLSGKISAVYKIPGNQHYDLKGDIQIEGDWSNASVWLAAGALSGPVTCTGLNMESMQGDRRIVEIIKAFGAGVEIEGDSITVSPGPLKGINIDLTDNPDIVPSVWLIGLGAEGTTEITNGDKRRFIEYNRLAKVKEQLHKLKDSHGADVIKLDCFGDHRIAMVEAASACIADKPIEIFGSEVVTKSYPAFFEDLETLMK